MQKTNGCWKSTVREKICFCHIDRKSPKEPWEVRLLVEPKILFYILIWSICLFLVMWIYKTVSVIVIHLAYTYVALFSHWNTNIIIIQVNMIYTTLIDISYSINTTFPETDSSFSGWKGPWFSSVYVSFAS